MEYKIFWCKVNKYYTDEWLNSEYLKDKKGIFIASCVVTDKAKRKWLKFVKDLEKTIKNDESIFISWCWAFKDWIAQDDFFDLYPEISHLRWRIIILWEKPKEIEKNIINSKEERSEWLKAKLAKLPQLYTKKFLLIQWGCDSFCTFCLTVQKRWKHYYRDKQDIVDEINEFEKAGWKEVVLTWINLSAWWLETTNPDLPNNKPLTSGESTESNFAELIEYILTNTKIPRIRISSMWPEFITDKCFSLFENTRIYPHFHYSVQSGSSKILKSMHRHYDWDYMKDMLKKTKNIKRNDWVEVSIWADLIVGFPWETEEDFKDTLNLVKKWLITKVHAFPFSWHNKAEPVPAWKFPMQLQDSIKKERMWKLEEESDKTRDTFIDRNIWKEFNVLIEVVKEDENWKIKWKWWTENYIEADQNTFEITSGKIWKNEIVVWILK